MAKIIIELDTEKGDTLERALMALIEDGGYRFDPNAYKPLAQDDEAWKDYLKQDSVSVVNAGNGVGAAVTANFTPGNIMSVNPITGEVKTFTKDMQPLLTEMDGDRKRGEPKPGGRRRTNAQIEEDARYFAQVEAAKADAARAASGVPPVTFTTFNDGKHALATMDAGVELHPDTAAISTDGERVSREDAADEEAETAQRQPGAEPTLEDLRAAYARYAAKFGAPAAIKDVRTILGCGVSVVPPDKIAEGIAKIDAAIAAENIDAHLAETTVDTIQTVSPQIATQADVVEAMKAYGRKFDGSDDPEKMVFTKEDLPKVFGATFGPKVTGLGSLPDKSPETFGTLLAAITAATETNAFQRAVK